MREIEIKLRVPKLDEVERVLRELGVAISEPIVQDDQNFIHKDDVHWYESVMLGFAYPRIRKQSGQLPILTVKKPLLNEMDCAEYEVAIESDDEMPGMLELLGFVPGMRVQKSRRTAQYKDYAITLDEVVGLGSFIEIERVVEDGDPETMQEAMYVVAKDLFGLGREAGVMKGYDILMYEAAASRA